MIMPNLESFFSMITQNIFRPLPTIKQQVVPGEEDEDMIIDPAWPHL